MAENGALKILVFGTDRSGFREPRRVMDCGSFVLNFEPFNSRKKFQDFDGVITYQSIFEEISQKRNGMGKVMPHHDFYRDDLDRRDKELKILLDRGGFVGFVMTMPFVEKVGSTDISGTDLSKRYSFLRHLYRDNFNSRIPDVYSNVTEFDEFAKQFGASWVYFRPLRDDVDTLMSVGDVPVGISVNSNILFIPSLVPDEETGEFEKYFRLLSESIIAFRHKKSWVLPEWVEEFYFSEEEALVARLEELRRQVDELEEARAVFDHYKTVVCSSGDSLVESVKFLLERGIGFRVDSEENYREDLRLLGDGGEVFALAEVKGVAKGVKRQFVNQIDSNREIGEYDEKFPAILLLNTYQKGVSSLTDKYVEVEEEQVEHAKRSNVLILRTIDLLNLLEMKFLGHVDKSEIREIFESHKGWLKIENRTLEKV